MTFEALSGTLWVAVLLLYAFLVFGKPKVREKLPHTAPAKTAPGKSKKDWRRLDKPNIAVAIALDKPTMGRHDTPREETTSYSFPRQLQ